jgi:hypothetical protein
VSPRDASCHPPATASTFPIGVRIRECAAILLEKSSSLDGLDDVKLPGGLV